MGEQLKTELAKEGNISLILDSYDDLFSDFDPRPYSEKALSEDFLDECNRAVRDKEDGAELRLLVPQQLRRHAEEAKIKKRLKSHFQKHFEEQKRKVKHTRLEGLMWFFIGTVVMIGAAFLYPYEGVNFFLTLLFVVSEPAGWFLFWEGLDKFLMEYKRQLPKYLFYKKMSKLEIYFMNY
jgi:hypothetical protein